MLQSLFYKIADHLFEILSTNATLAKKNLPNFDPFLIPFADAKKQGMPLFRFFADRQITIPNTEPINIFSSEQAQVKIYEIKNIKILRVERDNVVRILKMDTDKNIFESDVSLDDPAELNFQKHFLNAAFNMATSVHKTMQVHASAIEKNGKALLFLGPSGTGKSTHSRLWLQHISGASLLNDDEPVIRFLNTGEARAYGTPWSGSTPCYRNASAQLAGFVHLYQSSQNKLTRLNGMQAVSEVMKHCRTVKSDEKIRQMIFNALAEMLSSVPVYRLDCRPDAEAVALTSTLID